jgi:site-specific DNA-cytosine methylase
VNVTARSYCSGYEGLTHAARQAFGDFDVLSHSDIKPASNALLAHHYPDVPNLGDMRAIDYSGLERADLMIGSWPCFTGDTIVVTERGTVPIDEVVVGDLVLTHRNRWRRVLHTGSRNAPLHEVRAHGAPPIRTTADHPFYVRDFKRYVTGSRKVVERWSEPEWAPASEIAGRRAAIPASIDSTGGVNWPMTAWLVGRWVADGWAEIATRRVKFAIGNDKAEKFRAEVARAGLTMTEYEQAGCIRFTVGNTDIGEWLVANFGSGAGGKRLPGWLLADGRRAEWLDGYLAGDGHDHAGTSWAVSISRALSVGVAVLGATIGLAPQVKLTTPDSTKQIEGRTVNQRPWYRVGLKQQLPDRRRVRWDGGMAWGVVKSCRPLGRTDQVWNLHVEEDNSYTADGLVVHNCQPHSSAGKRLGEADPRDLWPEYLRAIRETRPAIFFGENVARIASNGELRRAVQSLAELGYVGAWRVLSAADVGACHLRKRCFIVAADGAAAHALGLGLRYQPGWSGGTRRESSGVAGHDGSQGSLQRLSLLPTPTQSMTTGAGTSGRDGGMNLQTAVACLPTPSVADSRNTRNATARRSEGQEHHHSGWTLCDVAHADTWGKYGPAIARHEQAFGRRAPEPTRGETKAGNPLLNPAFVEWMMMLPDGHIGDVPNLTRSQQLSLLGDGVVPAQGAAAFGFLLDHLSQRFAAEVAA